MITDLKHYKVRLETRLKELGGRLDHIQDELDEMPSPDFEERATERESDEVLQKLGESGAHEILQIRYALKRIREGNFGICVECGENIDQKRLDAVPHTALCINCAKKH